MVATPVYVPQVTMTFARRSPVVLSFDEAYRLLGESALRAADALAQVTMAAKDFVPVARFPKAERNWLNGFQLGPKTRGARDASRRSRSRRRKARG